MSSEIGHVLIVDDETNIREILYRGLTRAGFECHTAENAQSAAEILKTEDVDLVLLDIGMPGQSGMGLLADITAEHPDVAVMMLTGNAEVATAVQAMRDGAYDYATKPLSLAELTIRANNALARRSLLLENREYQKKLERMVDQLNARQAQGKRELAALNNLFRAHVTQNSDAAQAYYTLQQAMTRFTAELDKLVDMADIVGPTAESIPVQ